MNSSDFVFGGARSLVRVMETVCLFRRTSRACGPLACDHCCAQAPVHGTLNLMNTIYYILKRLRDAPVSKSQNASAAPSK
eukprot:2819006-Amphidinium_carterae.1